MLSADCHKILQVPGGGRRYCRARMKWFLTLLMACAVLAAVLHVRQSRRVVTNEPASAKTNLPPPSATPSPVAATPVEKPPEPPEVIAPVPPSTPAPQLSLADIAQNRALWPKQVLLVKPVVFPVVLKQRPMGTVTLAPGRAVDVLAVGPQGLTLAFQGGTRLVPADATNVLEMARRLAPPPVSSGTTASRTDAAAVSPPLSSLAPVRAPNAPPRAVPTPTAPPPIADSQPLESIRHQPSAHPANIVPQFHAYLPMDETLARVVVDFSGRPYLEYRAPAGVATIGTAFSFTLIEEFLRAFSVHAGINLHVEILYGRDAHHMAEAVFKGLAKAVDAACQLDPRVEGVPSTKGML